MSGLLSPWARADESLKTKPEERPLLFESRDAVGSALLRGVGRPAAEVELEGGWVTTGVAPGSSTADGSSAKRSECGLWLSAVECDEVRDPERNRPCW